eukprot:gnl/TRDRNA2_/TRDRNA2_129833_c1_seq2.p1 gnl/TRDRNA2_/TRDRNA2_129833_c1~~gnl/TRDRNA2_/TRDRNA2_129833_c1_seq2.p1  ORF type:complete len:197 (-),score=10.42 gnl/TRDRNA2_/TRDRNA2_129833_c1_seq2:65-655(-)
MGLLNKVFLKFKVLPSELDGRFGFLDVSALLDKRLGEFHNLNAYSISQPVLVGLMHGDTARRLERLNDSDIVSEAMASLRVIFPDLDDPEDFLVTRWSADENARGSYTYWPVNLTAQMKQALQDREGRLFLAGEGTSVCDWGTVEGAVMTGKSAAQTIMQDLGLAVPVVGSGTYLVSRWLAICIIICMTCLQRSFE